MRIIQRGRQGGKTTEILKAMVEDKNLFMALPSQQRAEHAFMHAHLLGFELPQSRFVVVSQHQSRWRLPQGATLAVDEVDEVLARLLGIPVAIATFTGEIDSRDVSEREEEAR